MNFSDRKEKISAEKAIVETVVFFDMFDFPLTELEIWKFMMAGYSFSEAQRVLASGVPDKYLERKNGFYFLHGRKKIISKRLEKYNFADRKFKRALRVADFLSILPWIRMIAVGNIIGPHNLRDDSDIDLFVITETNRLWAARFLAVIFMKLFGLRPRKGDNRDKICLSFFVSEKAMDLKDLMLDEGDYYFVYWLAGLAPIYGHDFYDKFMESNKWIHEYLPNWRQTSLVPGRRSIGKFSFLSFVFMPFGYLEKILKIIQIKIMPRVLKEAGNRDTRVVFNDKILKFHSNDRRSEYRQRFVEEMKKYENIK